jgi:hypothetical protein
MRNLTLLQFRNQKGAVLKRIFLVWISIFLLLVASCDPSGNIIITNGYPCTILVYIEAESKDKKLVIMESKMNYAPAAMGHIEYNNISKICIKNTNGMVLAEYNHEYILRIRNTFKQNGYQQESWIFSEKGLFFITKETKQKYKFDFEKILEYYRSDEAVNDLNAALNRS